MFTRPADLTDADVATAVATGWEIDVSDIGYEPVGFGSHHWLVADGADRRWFVTVDDLPAKRRWDTEPVEGVMARLRAALETAVAVRRAGGDFAVAPVPSVSGEAVLPLGRSYAIAVYPHVEGRTHDYGEYDSDDDRRGVLAVLDRLHAMAIDAPALVDDHSLPHRHALDPDLPWTGRGPYTDDVQAVLADATGTIDRLLRHYDRLAGEARARPERRVLTHGEPHLANTIRTDHGWVLIDWDTVMYAPPERDLWMLGGTDFGRPVLLSMLDMYRVWWTLAEIGCYSVFFRRDHDDTDDARESWKNLVHYLDAARSEPV